MNIFLIRSSARARRSRRVGRVASVAGRFKRVVRDVRARSRMPQDGRCYPDLEGAVVVTPRMR